MPIPPYVAALKAMQHAPTDTNTGALVSMLEQEPELGANVASRTSTGLAARATLMRVVQEGAGQYRTLKAMPSTEALDFGAPNTLPVHATSLGFDASQTDQWVSSPVGLRWVKASEDFLSPQYGRTPNANETLDRYATYMMDTWGARPHWGQQNPMNKARFQRVYGDAVKRFLPAYRELNPNGFFDGPLAQQLGLRDLSHAS